ncbi:MAG: hypothetical protein IKW74_05645, partial [Thermoguttaceae bacterium]|nr:hypothetical protein [Thermoguttaceae bacterium]
LVNIVSSIVFIKVMGYVGAAVGTCLSMLLGHGVLMNYYYQTKLGLSIRKMFAGILHKTFPAAVIVTILFVPVSVYPPYSLHFFLIKCLLYPLVMFIVFYFFAMNDYEKSVVNGYLRRIGIRNSQQKGI